MSLLKIRYPISTTAIAVGLLLTVGTPILAQMKSQPVISRDERPFNVDNGKYEVDAYVDAYNEGDTRTLYRNPGDFDGMYYGKGPLPYSEKDWMFYERYKDEELLSSDIELRAQILKNLSLSPFVYEDSIHVSVNSGIATLSGDIEDRGTMIEAEEIAYDAGAWKVRNQLRLNKPSDRPWEEMSDSELEKDVQGQLRWSPFVNADRIIVSVRNGVVTLYGGVENKGEIADAVENAYEAGAKRVKSRLWVDPDFS